MVRDDGALRARQPRWSPLVAGVLLALLGCSNRDEAPAKAEYAAPEPRLTPEPLQPLPAVPVQDGRLVTLGQRLFFEKRMSSDNRVSCASCHDLERGGDDGQARSKGVGGRLGGINSPTVLNASLNFTLFWDGRAKTLEEQVSEPLTDARALDTTWPAVVSKLERDAAYRAAFRALFADGITANNVSAAIAAFERTLLTRGSAFDRWLEGDAGALSNAQKSGYELFKSVGCIACHQGRNVGGNMFQRFGVLGDYFSDRGDVGKADYGRFNVTGNEVDRFVFRVPSLRNVENTAPYFHDGSAATLPEAVKVMGKYQLGRSLSDAQVASIVAFLGSLTGLVPDTALRADR